MEFEYKGKRISITIDNPATEGNVYVREDRIINGKRESIGLHTFNNVLEAEKGVRDLLDKKYADRDKYVHEDVEN